MPSTAALVVAILVTALAFAVALESPVWLLQGDQVQERLLMERERLAFHTPSLVSNVSNADEMATWLQQNGFTDNRVVKVLALGNSGAGKSLLCNALVGSNTFAHATQAKSVTSANTYVAAVMRGTAYVICNIPGLIEADAANVPRNKAAIEAAFAFLPRCRTVALLVASPVGGRVKSEDYAAIRAVHQYVKLHAAATAFVVNGVDWDEMGDADASMYRFEVEQQVHAMVEKGMRVAFTEMVVRTNRQDYRSDAMLRLQALLWVTLTQLTPMRMQPTAGAKLVLDKERMEEEVAKLNVKMSEEKKRFERRIQENNEEATRKLEESEKKHEEELREKQKMVDDLKNRPPQIIEKHIHHHHGCFSADEATVMDAASGAAVAIREVRVGDVVMGFDPRTGALAPSPVLLVDRHEGERTRMLRLRLAGGGGGTLVMTPEHLVYVRPAAAAASAAMREAGSVRAGDALLVPGSGRSATGDGEPAWRRVASVTALVAEPINVYTASGTVVVGGVAASCYTVSEWWGWLDMLPTRLLAWVSPQLPAHPVYERVRRASDRVTDAVLYRAGALRTRLYALLARST